MTTATTPTESTAPPTAKDGVIEMIRRLPPDATAADIMYALYVRQAIEEGVQQLDAGQGIPQEEVERRMAKWLT